MNIPDKQIAAFIANRSLVCIRRENIDSRSLQAFPICYSSTLLLVQYVFDFHLDGQLILRRDEITSMTCRATDKFQRRLLAENELTERIDFDMDAELSSFSDLLNSQPEQSIVILENEGLDDSSFWIGRFVETDSDVIQIHGFSGAANWDDEVTSIDPTEITCCQLNTNYILFYARHFQNHPPSPISS